VTLVEVLMVVAIVGLLGGLVALSAGSVDSARLKRSAVTIASAIRVAYAHANAISKPVRLVFDFDERAIILEEGSSDLALARGDRTGGAAAATEAERKALAEADAIVKGPRPPRPSFKPTKAFGFNPDKGKSGKELEKNIRFLQVEATHLDDPVRAGRAYLYFWPGGQTERAAVQISIRNSDIASEVMTVLVSPLTGKAEIKKGKWQMPRPRDDAEESERREGF
jgi:general secretion pathway protein H